VEELEHHLAANEEAVRVEWHMQLCTSQDSATHVERKAMSCEGQDIQAAIPLRDINKRIKSPNR